MLHATCVISVPGSQTPVYFSQQPYIFESHAFLGQVHRISPKLNVWRASCAGWCVRVVVVRRSLGASVV